MPHKYAICDYIINVFEHSFKELEGSAREEADRHIREIKYYTESTIIYQGDDDPYADVYPCIIDRLNPTLYNMVEPKLVQGSRTQNLRHYDENLISDKEVKAALAFKMLVGE